MTDAEDATMFARLRELWQDVDPVPATLIDRMVAAVAAEGLAHEYALLTLVEDRGSAVRSEADALTLQFSDGSTSILLHVTTTADNRRRVDGWTDADAAEIVLSQGERSRSTTPAEHGRFAFDGVPTGLTRVLVTVREGSEQRTLSTPQFEL
ncbi:MAG TPA: hypothetical protein VN241_10995 [Microbacterium sp.]|nr:hypothetical protein [Microbacterium sp.]